MTIFDKLNKIQTELKAPKGQYNNFGKYKYRSCEDILEGVKPLLAKYECSLIIGDRIIQLGDRYYIEATATLRDNDGMIENKAYAREPEQKKGMDEAQITGATSSYARKYALNGLLAIDDTKDADTMDNTYKFTDQEKKKIDSFTDLVELRKYYVKNKGKGKEFDSYIITKSKSLKKQNENTQTTTRK